MGQVPQPVLRGARQAAPILIVVLSLLVTAIAVAYVRQTAAAHDRERFDETVRQAQADVERRIDTYIAILRGTAGFLSATSWPTPAEFRVFTDRLHLRESYPGTLGVGVATRTNPDDLGRLLAWMRDHGESTFRVWPLSKGEMYPIQYIEPLDWRNRRAIGFEMFSDPSRRAAMEKARDGGQPTASKVVTLVQETESGTQPGFLIYVPVYEGAVIPETVEERRRKIVAFAYAPLRIGDLFQGIFAQNDPQLEFQIFQGDGETSDATFLYDSDPTVGPPEKNLRSVTAIDVAGQPWTFVFTPRRSFLAHSEMRLVPLVSISGLALTALFFGITLTLSKAWATAEKAAAELARSRDELRETAERFRVALKNAPIIVYNTDLDLRYTWIANNPPRLSSAESIIGKRDDEILPAGEVELLMESKRQVLRSGVSLRREIPIRIGADLRFYDVTIEPLRDDVGRLNGLTVAAIDITDLRRAFEQVRLAARAVRSLIYDWDAATDTVERTEGLMDVLGFRPEEADPRMTWWESRVHPEDIQAYRDSLAQALAGSERYALEYRVRHRDGRWVDVWDHGIIVRDRGGTALRVVGNAMNISARRDAERALARHAEELRRSNADLEDFAYIASHDLKEPLRGIANYARFLEEDQAPELGAEGQERVRTIQRLAQHMYGLLDSLLEFSRVGRTQLAVQPVDLSGTVREIVSGLKPWIEQEGGTVRIIDELPVIRADRVRVGQVFANLITNGIKYNARPEKLVEIGIAENDGLGPVVYVRDNGIGIPPRHQPKLFHMFKRLHARSQYGGGTGSGLAIAKKIVERHGGRIWLESEPGRGTTFYFTLQPGADSAEPPRVASGSGASA
jgi:PAS domain S-box-containing protein